MNLMRSGGCGKSFVLDATKSCCKQFCKAIGKPFNDSVFIVTATTNIAVDQLKGDIRGEVWFGSPYKGIPPVLTILLCSLKLHDIWVMLLI